VSAEGRLLRVRLEKTGRKLTPDRVVPANVKWTLELPEHLAVVDVSLDRVEELLPKHFR
jgi:hypothetical protein